MRQRGKVWMIGAGAVGSALAAILAAHTDVILVGDSPHAEIVSRNGLRVSLYGGYERRVSLDVRSSMDIKDMGETDLILLAGKIWSLDKIASRLKDQIHPGQWIVALQNGMGFEEKLEKDLGVPVQRGIVQFGANSSGQGDIRYYGGKLIFPLSPQAEMLRDWMHESPVVCEITPDFARAQWHKLLINCVANPLAGLLRVNNQAISHPDLNDVKAPLLAEIKAVATAEGVDLNTSLEELNGYFKSENVPSLVRDLERNMPTEIEYINGYIARRGRVHGIATPVNEALTAMIRYISEIPRVEGKEVEI